MAESGATCQALAEALQVNRSVSRLDLANQEVTDTAAKATDVHVFDGSWSSVR